MKLLIGGIAHETNTFATGKTEVADFRLWEWSEDEAVIMNNRGVRNYIGGMIDQAETLSIDLLPTFSTFATPSGIISEDASKTMVQSLVDRIKKATDYDAIVLSLHGAGVSEEAEDFEGHILTEVRNVVGKEMPIVVTLDLHANMTQKMVELADVIIGNHLYPHTDSYEIGKEAVDLAKEIVEGKLTPTMHLIQLPLMISTSTTNLPPAKDVNELCFQYEEKEKVIDCTFYHGFPYTNISRFGTAVLVSTNNDETLAKEIAHNIAQYIWEQKDAFKLEHPDPYEGIQQALKHEGAPVVLNETSDNPGAGTPGDGTYLLEAMTKSNLTKACFAFIYDPEVVQTAIKAGVGKTIDIELGGKTDPLHGEPLPMKAYVKTITDGKFVKTSPMGKGEAVDLGPSVRLQYNGVDIIVCSARSQVFDDVIFTLHGIDLDQYKIVGLKSSQHFRAGFEPISSKIITVDSPGLSTLNFKSFEFSNLKAKLYPLAKDVSFP